MFADSPVPAGSRPSTVDSRLKKRQNGDIGFRPKSAGPRFGTSELVIERIGPTKENHYESSISKEALAIPEHGHESDILEMHPNVPTPEVGYYDDLNRMCYFLYCLSFPLLFSYSIIVCNIRVNATSGSEIHEY